MYNTQILTKQHSYNIYALYKRGVEGSPKTFPGEKSLPSLSPWHEDNSQKLQGFGFKWTCGLFEIKHTLYLNGLADDIA